MRESIERRVFGALEFVHAVTRARITAPLQISAEGLRLTRNPRGLYVIREAEALEAYAAAFDDPPQPAPRAFTLTIEDREGRFSPRKVSIDLPRQLQAQHATPVADADNALVPIQVLLWPAAAMPLAPGWAALRLKVAVDGSADERGLANVWVAVAPALPGAEARHALTDHHGEALVVVPGVAPILPGAGATLTPDFKATLTLTPDPQVVRPAPPASAAPGQPLPIPDPRLIEQRAGVPEPGVKQINGIEVSLSAGRSRRHVERVTWP